MKLDPCKFCGGKGNGLARITCTTCGARTRSFVGTSGEFQGECDAAAFAWNRGEYEQPVARNSDSVVVELQACPPQTRADNGAAGEPGPGTEPLKFAAIARIQRRFRGIDQRMVYQIIRETEYVHGIRPLPKGKPS